MKVQRLKGRLGSFPIPGRFYYHPFPAARVFEGQTLGVEFDFVFPPKMPAIGYIAHDGASDMGELSPDLMVPARAGANFQEGLRAIRFQHFIGGFAALGIWLFPVKNKGSFAGIIAFHPMNQGAGGGWRRFFNHGLIRFFDLPVFKLIHQNGQRGL